jgi:plastocyanin
MRVLKTALAALTTFALAAGVAYADATIYAAPPSQFVGGDVTIAQGEKVTFQNGDTLGHDVTANDRGPDGKPLFFSATIGPAQSAPVEGVEYLTTGAYGYICSLHPYMTGTITVSSEGTPKPRPGGGGGGSSTGSPSAPAADTTAPTLSVKLLDTRRSSVRKRRSLQLSVTVDEAVTASVKAVAGKKTVATGKANLKAGTRKVSVKLTKAGLKLAKGRKPVRISVTVSAKDAAGNAGAGSASGRLR